MGFFEKITSFFCQLKQWQVGDGDTQFLFLFLNHNCLIPEFKFYIAPFPGDKLLTHVALKLFQGCEHRPLKQACGPINKNR